MRKLRPLFYKSLYTAVCPIVLIDNEHLMEAVEAYYQYVVSMQQEYRELFEFCFVDEFYNGVLGNLHAIERYHVYRKITISPMKLKEKNTFSMIFFIVGRMKRLLESQMKNYMIVMRNGQSRQDSIGNLRKNTI